MRGNFRSELLTALMFDGNDKLAKLGRRALPKAKQLEQEQKDLLVSQQRLVGKVHTRSLEDVVKSQFGR